jgi:hypothetical protein
MAQTTPQLTRRTLVLAKVETTAGTDAAPTAVDALLVSAPDFSVDLNVLERDFVRDDLSPMGPRVGRKIAKMKFALEAKGNGASQSGLIGDAPKIGRLLRACGFSETAITGAGTRGAVRPLGVHPVSVSWVGASTNTNPTYYDFQLTCVLAGASATARVRVVDLNGKSSGHLRKESFTASAASAAGTVTVAGTPIIPTYTVGGTWVAGDRLLWDIGGYSGSITVPAGGEATTAIATQLDAAMDAVGGPWTAAPSGSTVTVTLTGAAAGVVVTTAVTALTLGETTVTETPTWSGSLTLGQYWRVSIAPPSVAYRPISTGFETCTLYMYVDGNLHKMTNCQGTFTIAADSGGYGRFEFEFTGQYVAPLDANLPSSPTFETATVPPVFELAQLRVDSEDITIGSLSYNQNNVIAIRPDANSLDGYVGVRITGRNPQGGVNPESHKVGDYDFWGRLAASTLMPMSCRFGQTAGNIIWMRAPGAIYSGLTYQDRDGIRVYDAGLSFARESGNDEIEFAFA